MSHGTFFSYLLQCLLVVPGFLVLESEGGLPALNLLPCGLLALALSRLLRLVGQTMK